MSVTSGAKVQLTVDEIVALLKKSSLPTVVCEGANDLIFFRRLEDQLRHLGVSVLPAYGRENVLKVYERRAEFPTSLRIAFVADKDTWINTGVPDQYQNETLIFTDGYSIENDAYSDGDFEDLLVGPERATFSADLSAFIHWYALALARHLADPANKIKNHPDDVLDQARRAQLLKREPDEPYPTNLESLIFADYKRLLRGKSLLALLVKTVNSRHQQPRHSDKALLEMVAARPGVKLGRLSTSISAILS